MYSSLTVNWRREIEWWLEKTTDLNQIFCFVSALFFLEEEYLHLFEGVSGDKDQRCWKDLSLEMAALLSQKDSSPEAEEEMRGQSGDTDTEVEGR